MAEGMNPAPEEDTALVEGKRLSDPCWASSLWRSKFCTRRILSAAPSSEKLMTAGNGGVGVRWSDHSGLLCSFVIDDATR